MASREHKITAKEALHGNWGLAISLLIISFGLPSLLTLIPILGLITFIIIAPAIAYVPTQLLLRVKRKEEVHFNDFFKYTFSKRLGKYWLVSLLITLIIFIANIILIGAGKLVSIPLANISSTLGNVIITIFTILTYIITYYLAFRYSQVAYIMLDHPELNARKTIRKSAELMKGNMLKLLCLYLSFIGWFILTVLSLGLASFYVLPYLYTALASFYDGLIGHNNTEEIITDTVIEEQ